MCLITTLLQNIKIISGNHIISELPYLIIKEMVIVLIIVHKDHRRPCISVTVIRTSRSGSSARERICFFIDSRIDGLSNLLAIYLSTFTHTSRMLATGSLEAEMIIDKAFSMKVSPWTERHISFRE